MSQRVIISLFTSNSESEKYCSLPRLILCIAMTCQSFSYTFVMLILTTYNSLLNFNSELTEIRKKVKDIFSNFFGLSFFVKTIFSIFISLNTNLWEIQFIFFYFIYHQNIIAKELYKQMFPFQIIQSGFV